MKRLRRVPVLMVVFLGLLAGKGLIGPGYFNMHDDLQMMRQLQMEKCFLDLQIPCRWVADMGYGFGYPLFNFYPPLPYLVGEILRLAGYTFVGTVKALFIISLVASGVAMYFLAKEFFGRFGGVVAAVFYVWAPYHAVDVYVRGAMNEAWAMIWFPLILWSGYKLLESGEEKQIPRQAWNDVGWVVVLALSWFGLFTSHNLMVLIFTPIFGLWCLIWFWQSKTWRKLPYLVLAGFLAFGLSAFFTLPVLLEKGKVATDTLVVGYYEYTAHFVNISQLLFSRFWGYGPSVWMAMDDRMSFQIGWIHWGLSLVIGLLLVKRILNRVQDDDLKKIWNDKLLLAVGLMIVVGWFSAFMAHPRSTPIWQAIGSLKFVQFPWRFLTIVILAFSFVAGAVVKLMPKLVGVVVGLVLMILVLIYSWSYFLPEYGKLGPLTDEEKFYGLAWDLQQTAGIYDYLPEAAKTAPKEPRRYVAEVVEGEGSVPASELGTDWAEMTVYMESDGVLRINIIDFDDWRVWVDGQKVAHFVPEDEEWGRIHIDLSSGRHEVRAKLADTWPRVVGNWVSLGSWGILIGVLVVRKKELV